jgi:hypothetical protein
LHQGTTSSQLETVSPSRLSSTAWKRTATRLDCEQDGPTTMPWAPAVASWGHQGDFGGPDHGENDGKSWENHGKIPSDASYMNINDTSSSASSTKKGNLQRQWSIACPESYHGAGQEWGIILRLTLLEIALCAVSLWDFRGLSCC